MPKIMNFHVSIAAFTRMNSNWLIDLNIKGETLKFLEENPCDLGFTKEFLDIIPNA